MQTPWGGVALLAGEPARGLLARLPENECGDPAVFRKR